jgi:hypothetical protein
MVLLAVWLIGSGVLTLAPRLPFTGAAEILAVLAIASGVVILWERY